MLVHENIQQESANTIARLDFSVLVLNASYEAINICNLKRAITLIFKGVACAEEETEHEIRSASMVIRVPTVIRLLKFIR
ncbi:MAG: HNH endonuclease, partial [Candidatus Poribacteria bacterium]